MVSFEIQVLETERLRLRPFRASDFDNYAAMNADPKILRYLGVEPWDRGRAWRHPRRRAARREAARPHPPLRTGDAVLWHRLGELRRP